MCKKLKIIVIARPDLPGCGNLIFAIADRCEIATSLSPLTAEFAPRYDIT